MDTCTHQFRFLCENVFDVSTNLIRISKRIKKKKSWGSRGGPADMTLAHRRHGQRRHLNWAWDAYWSRWCRWMMGRINQLHCGPRESSEPSPIQPSWPPDTSTRRCWRVFPVCFVCVSVNTRWFPSPRGPHFSAQLLDGKASIRSMEGPFRQQWRLLYQLISSNNSLPILGILLLFLFYILKMDGYLSLRLPPVSMVF